VKNYLLKRLLLLVPTMIGITLLVFTLTRLVPGGPIERMMSQMKSQQEGSSMKTSSSLTPEQLEELKAFYGFDKPILASYLDWVTKLVQFDLGTSTRYFDPVWETIKDRLPVSCFYGIMTMLLTYIICIPLGILKAIKHKSSIDSVTSVLVFIGYAVPPFVIGIGLLVLFASHLQWFPISGFTSDDFESLSLGAKMLDILHHAALPLIAYMLGSFAVMTFLMKNTLMEQLGSDYMRTAIAKGNTFRGAVVKHALRNSLIPMATHFGNNVSVIIAGSFLIEKIFNINGFGLLGYESVLERDYPVVMGILVIAAFLQLFGNILSDICVAIADPRVRFGAK
jgi:microcin C transport system permease protein